MLSQIKWPCIIDTTCLKHVDLSKTDLLPGRFFSDAATLHVGISLPNDSIEIGLYTNHLPKTLDNGRYDVVSFRGLSNDEIKYARPGADQIVAVCSSSTAKPKATYAIKLFPV